MKKALVTGATKGIGLAISKKLLEEGYQVYGIGRDFSNWKEPTENFIPISMDLCRTGEVAEWAKKMQKDMELDILVNNAGVGHFGPHEQLNYKKIHEMVAINMEIPMILSQIFSRNLKRNKGSIVNISSVTAKASSPFGCAYGATKAGISAFSGSLFEEVRKYGVRVITIHPDMTQTSFYEQNDFCYEEKEESSLLAKEVADICYHAVSAREGLVFSDITMKPQIHRIIRKKPE